MRSHNDSIDTTHTPPPLSFYNTFNTGFYGAFLNGVPLRIWTLSLRYEHYDRMQINVQDVEQRAQWV